MILHPALFENDLPFFPAGHFDHMYSAEYLAQRAALSERIAAQMAAVKAARRAK
jgi:hypothetical protein